MNEVIKNMVERRSIRKFKSEMIPEADIEQVIKAGIYAANGKGQQSAKVIAVTNQKLRDRISQVNCQIGGWDATFDPFYNAPVILIVVAKADWPTRVYDGSLVLGNMMNAAHSIGLGSIWIHRAKEEFEMDEFKALLTELGIEGEWEGIGHCALGYIDGEMPKAADRKADRVYWYK